MLRFFPARTRDIPPLSIWPARIWTETAGNIREVLPTIGGGDTRIRLSTGDVFIISGTAEISELEQYFPRQGRLGASLSRMELVGWRGMVLLSLIFLSLLIGFRFAIAPAGDLLAKAAPPSLVAKGSGLVLAQLDMTVLEESALPDQQRQRLQAEFERMKQQHRRVCQHKASFRRRLNRTKRIRAAGK